MVTAVHYFATLEDQTMLLGHLGEAALEALEGGIPCRNSAAKTTESAYESRKKVQSW